MDKSKIIEQNAISFLKMRTKESRNSREDVSENIKDIFVANNQTPSDQLLQRVTRVAMNEAKGLSINKDSVIQVLLWVIRQHGHESLIEEVNEFLK